MPIIEVRPFIGKGSKTMGTVRLNDPRPGKVDCISGAMSIERALELANMLSAQRGGQIRIKRTFKLGL